MLDVLRKNSKHWLVTAIIAVIIVGLGFFFGSSNKDTVKGAGWAAKIDGETIKMGEFLNKYRAVVDNYRTKLGANFDEKMLEQLNIKSYILKNLVDEKLAAKDAYKNGIGVSDDELVDSIRQYPAFQKEGAFSMEYYKQLLSYNRIKPAEFEKMQKEDMLRQKLRTLIGASVKASDQEILTAYRSEAETTSLLFITVDTSNLQSSVSPEDVKNFLNTEAGKKEATDYYTKHNEEFKIPAMNSKPATIKMYNDVKENIVRNILLKKKEASFYATKVDNALKSNNIDAAAKLIGQKVQSTTSFSRKSPSIPGMLATNSNDAIWSFGLEKGKIYKREVNNKTYIVAVKDKSFKPLDVKNPDFEQYKQKFLQQRASDEFMGYVKNMEKTWAKKVEYSPYLLKDMRETKEETL